MAVNFTDAELQKILKGIFAHAEEEKRMDKVHGGTPKNTGTICTSCRNAMVMKGINFEHKIYCALLGNETNGGRALVTFPVAECSQYDDKRVPALHQMREVAWVIRSRNRGPVGFVDGQKTLDVSIDPPGRRGIPYHHPDEGTGE